MLHLNSITRSTVKTKSRRIPFSSPEGSRCFTVTCVSCIFPETDWLSSCPAPLSLAPFLCDFVHISLVKVQMRPYCISCTLLLFPLNTSCRFCLYISTYKCMLFLNCPTVPTVWLYHSFQTISLQRTSRLSAAHRHHKQHCGLLSFWSCLCARGRGVYRIDS